jgi:hypothetical protein
MSRWNRSSLRSGYEATEPNHAAGGGSRYLSGLHSARLVAAVAELESLTHMTTPVLSSETRRRLDILFRGEEREEAARLLAEQCGNNLPFLEKLDEHGLERFQFAALKLSGGDLSRLRSAIDLARTDWRDLLMAAGFGEDTRAHLFWIPTTR